MGNQINKINNCRELSKLSCCQMDFHKTERVLWGDKWSEVNEHLPFLNSNRSDLEIQGHICYIYYCLTFP